MLFPEKLFLGNKKFELFFNNFNNSFENLIDDLSFDRFLFHFYMNKNFLSQSNLLLLLDNDIQNGNSDSFVDHLKLLIFQDDQSGMNFSVYQYFSKISKTQIEFCSLLGEYLYHNLQNQDPVIQYFYAICLDVGCGFPQNQSEAFQFYQKSAEQNYLRAMNALAVCYETGEGVE
jgi:TPR repeat protein